MNFLNNCFTCDSGKNSFSRLACAFILVSTLSFCGYSIYQEYTRTEPNVNWDEMGSFLAFGVSPLVALLYAGNKVSAIFDKKNQRVELPHNG